MLNPNPHPLRRAAARLAPWALLLAVLAGLAVVHGLAANYDIGYQIMNGDFQNYNPVRHLLTGQAPYRDFTVYLGAGELYSVGGLLLVLGNSFGRSVFASNFCTWFYFETLVLAAAAVVLNNARQARAVTMAFSAWCLGVVHGVALPFAGPLGGLLGLAASNGNSARMIRSAVLGLAVLLCLGALGLWQKRPPRPGGRRAALLRPACFIPLIAGALVPWSNDMGAAMYISVALGYGLYLIRVYRADVAAIARKVLVYIGVSVCGLGAAVLLVSRFHPLAWLRQTRGVSAYQLWYYGTAAETRLCYLTDLRLSGTEWLCLALAAAFGVGIFRCRTARGAACAAGGFALCLGMPLWSVLYCLLSGVNAGPAGGAEVLLAALGAAGLAWAVRFLLRRLAGPGAAAARAKLARLVTPAAALLGCAAIALGARWQVAARLGGHEGLTYLPELGGWIGDQAEKLTTERTLAEGKTLFGTYSSALEAMTGQLQPTGADYIIHAMGDSQRLAYLQTFQAGAFDLVVTPSAKVAPSERWSRNANWWFYRELYRYWQPVANTYVSGGMHLFWQRTGVVNDLGAATAVTIEQTDPATVTLTVTADDPTFCGVADVTLTYRTAVSGGYRLRGGVHNYVFLRAVTENELCAARDRDTDLGNFFLPIDRQTYDIPVTISDGVGVVELSSLPAADTTLTVDAATVNATYFDWEYFYE